MNLIIMIHEALVTKLMLRLLTLFYLNQRCRGNFLWLPWVLITPSPQGGRGLG